MASNVHLHWLCCCLISPLVKHFMFDHRPPVRNKKKEQTKAFDSFFALQMYKPGTMTACVVFFLPVQLSVYIVYIHTQHVRNVQRVWKIWQCFFVKILHSFFSFFSLLFYKICLPTKCVRDRKCNKN